MLKTRNAAHIWLVALGVFLLQGQKTLAGTLVFDSQKGWEENWSLLPGLIEFDEGGGLGLVEYRRDINATQDAHLFTHPTNARGDVAGGIWGAESGAATAENIIDGDLTTYWKPGADDPLAKWIVQIDLGRAVLVKEIRVHFPDEEGVRPFRQFSVFASTGAHVAALDDVYRFISIYRTTQPNRESFIRFKMQRATEDSTRTVELQPDLDIEAEKDWRVIQFIRFIVDEKMDEGALAEIEVIAVGDNISLGTPERGGTYVNGTRATDPLFLLDGSLNTYGVVEVHSQFTESRQTFLESGLWWKLDLGAVFWLDEAFFYWQKAGERLATFSTGTNNAGTGYRLWSSDGATTLMGDNDFEEWVLEPEWKTSREQFIRHYRYFFKPRKIRQIYWHALKDIGWRAHPMELMLFSPGHPAEVVLRSDFMNLGSIAGDGQPKVIKNVFWDADLPADTRIQLRSRSGNTMQPIYTFYDKKGTPVTEEKWNSSPKVIRGPVDTTIVVGTDWDEWSNEYTFSGESFKSDSPRRFVQLELILATEDPSVAPVLNSLSIEYEDALLQEARGSILPRQAVPNEETRFTYTLWPRAESTDAGFDVLRFVLSDLVKADDVQVQIGDELVTPVRVSVDADSLLIVMPEPVIRDSVQVSFTTRLLHNATVVELQLGASEQPGLWQDVEPAERRSNVVLLPDLPGSERLIGNLEISTPILTPNGDGINDEVEIRFVTFKVATSKPRVRIYDMAGRLVAGLGSGTDGAPRVFTWSGRDSAGDLVEPGIYFLDIDLKAESGNDKALKTISVAY